MDGLRIESAQVNGTGELVLAGEIDMLTAPELRSALGRLHGCVTVDVAAVTFLGSTGIGVLAGQRNRLREQGGDLMLRSPQGIVRRALEITGLSDWVVDG